jgi:hypothetical protein
MITPGYKSITIAKLYGVTFYQVEISTHQIFMTPYFCILSNLLHKAASLNKKLKKLSSLSLSACSNSPPNSNVMSSYILASSHVMGRECVLVPYVHLKDVYNCHGDDDGRPTALISLFNKRKIAKLFKNTNKAIGIYSALYYIMKCFIFHGGVLLYTVVVLRKRWGIYRNLLSFCFDELK